MPDDAQILAAADGAPEVVSQGTTLPWSVSISHSQGLAACVVALDGDPRFTVGCDVERIEERSPAFIADWLTAAEQACLEEAPAAHRALGATLIWSAKESALKALRTGLRRDGRSVDVSVRLRLAAGWRPLSVGDQASGGVLFGWWRVEDRHVLTIVATEPTTPPRRLDAAG